MFGLIRKMKKRPLSDFDAYKKDLAAEHSLKNKFIPAGVTAVFSVVTMGIVFFSELSQKWFFASFIPMGITLAYTIILGFRYAPYSSFSGNKMTRYRNSESERGVFEIIYVDHESSTYFNRVAAFIEIGI